MDLIKTNSAVIKNALTLMNKATFIQHAKIIKQAYISLVPSEKNQNLELKYYNLNKFCIVWFRSYWCKKS